MKYLLALLLLLPLVGLAQTDKMTRITQYDAAVSGFRSRDILPPAASADGIFFYNATTGLPEYLTLGSGLSIAGNVLSASGGGSVTWSTLAGKPAWTGVFDGSYGSLTGSPSFATVATSGSYLDLVSVPSTFAPSPHTHAASDIVSGTLNIARIPDLAISNTTGLQTALDAKYDANNPSGYITSSALSPYLTTATAASTYYLQTNPSGYRTQAQVRADISLTTTGSGAASYNNSTGVLNVPTPAAATPFNFSQPAARTLAVSTSYQASDPSKAAIIYPSYACQNATQVLASSACTLQVRMGTSALTCSTGTVYYTQNLSVNLGLLITQNSTNPVPIFLPTGGHFIICASAGTFTITTIEQTAG